MRENSAVAARISDSVHLRELQTIFPLRRYSDETTATEVADWMREVYANSYAADQLEYFISQNVRDVVLSGFPKAASRHRVVWLMKYYEALTAVDDAANSRYRMTEREALHMVEELERSIHGQPVEFATDISRVMAECIQGMQVDMSEGLSGRFVDTFQIYLDRLRRELIHPGSHAMDLDTVEEFSSFRFENYSGPCILTQLEYAVDADITEQQRTEPDVEKIGRMAIYHSQIVNDLTSFGRESNHGEHCNLAYFLILKEEMKLQEAFDQLCDQAERYDEEFWRLRKRILSGSLAFDDDVLTYIHGLEYMIPGFDMWHFMTNRFRNPEYVWDGLAYSTFDTSDKPQNYLPKQRTS